MIFKLDLKLDKSLFNRFPELTASLCIEAVIILIQNRDKENAMKWKNEKQKMQLISKNEMILIPEVIVLSELWYNTK